MAGCGVGVACSRNHHASRALCPAPWGHSGRRPAPPCWHTGPPALRLQPLLSPCPALFLLSNSIAPSCLAGCVFYWHHAPSLPDPLWAVPASILSVTSPVPLPLPPLSLSLSPLATTLSLCLWHYFYFIFFPSLSLISPPPTSYSLCLSLSLCQPLLLEVSPYTFVSGLVSVCASVSLFLGLYNLIPSQSISPS